MSTLRLRTDKITKKIQTRKNQLLEDDVSKLPDHTSELLANLAKIDLPDFLDLTDDTDDDDDEEDDDEEEEEDDDDDEEEEEEEEEDE